MPYISSESLCYSQALILCIIRSKLISSFHKELFAIREQHNIDLCWVNGHKNILSNQKADELEMLDALKLIDEGDIVLAK